MAESSRLLDANGRPVSTADLRHGFAAPRVAGVRNIFTETIASGLTPAKLAVILQNAVEGDHHEYLTLAEEIEERDAHYRSVLGARRLTVSGLDVVVEAASDEGRDVELADPVRELLRDPAFGELVDDLLDALGNESSPLLS